MQFKGFARTEKAHGDMDTESVLCNGARNKGGDQYLQWGHVGDNIGVSYQYERHKSTVAERKQELRGFARKVSTPCHAWCLSRRRCLQDCYTSVHIANRWQERRIQLDVTRPLREGYGEQNAPYVAHVPRRRVGRNRIFSMINHSSKQLLFLDYKLLVRVLHMSIAFVVP